MKHKEINRIMKVEEGSIAEELGIQPGWLLVSVNGQEMQDIFDYQYLCEDEEVVLLVRTDDGEEIEYEIEKDADESIGLVFERGLMSDYRRCTNKCIFCFIDQMPEGMRETLYFKDDDSRLSFLQGNYVTLTNMKDSDIERIIRYNLGPINISVHTTNPLLRAKMLHNKFAGEALKKMDTLYKAGIPMNSQIVLCPGWNDGKELSATIGDLQKMIPVMQSLSVVPIGKTKYRDGLEAVPSIDKAKALETIEIVEEWQKKIFAEHGIHFVQASDEFYITAGLPIPEEERYDNYVQLENGVGMVRLLIEEVKEALQDEKGDGKEHHYTIATGRLAAPLIESLAEMVHEKHPKCFTKVYMVENRFFGEEITVAGLLTGQDLLNALKDKELGDCLYLPEVMFRSGEEVFLDDMTRTELEQALQVPVRIVESSGRSFVRSLIGDYRTEGLLISGHSAYEADQEEVQGKDTNE